MSKPIIIKQATFLSVLLLAALVFFSGCNGEPEREEEEVTVETEDMGKQPWVLDIEEATIANPNYRLARWTGEYMQMVLMSIEPGGVIDLEVHEDHDQFIRIEQGEARIRMGKTEEDLTFDENVTDDWAVFIPAGYWHEVRNTGNTDLKLYTIYAPPEHPSGTLHETYEDAEGYHE